MINYVYYKAVKADRLQDEILAAGLTSVNHIDTIGTEVHVFFSEEQTQQQLITLNAVVNSHQISIPLEMVKSRLKYYQTQAGDLIVDLYTQNTLAGITIAQSDEMFTIFSDVLLRLREGAWPTALYRLSQKQPDGFVTQEMINSWIALIQSKMI